MASPKKTSNAEAGPGPKSAKKTATKNLMNKQLGGGSGTGKGKSPAKKTLPGGGAKGSKGRRKYLFF